MSVLAALRSYLFLFVFYGLTVPASLLALPVALAGKRAIRGYAMAWVAFHGWCARWILGIRVRVEGAIPTGPVMIAAKHQANFEALDLPRLLGAPAIVMKRQLADIPIWGWVARRYGCISVDRTNGAGALRRMMREADAVVADGRTILIFPEGTRVRPGSQPPLQSGCAGLYRRLGLPVVPVALDSGRVWPKDSLVKRPGIITLRFGEVLPPGLPRAELESRVHEAMNALEPAAA